MNQNQFTFRLLMVGMFLALVSIAFTGCAGLTPKQKIGVSCESAASALDTLIAAKVGRKIDAGQLNDAIRIYEASVIPVCVPVAENASAIQKAAFAAAVAELARRAGGVQ